MSFYLSIVAWLLYMALFLLRILPWLRAPASYHICPSQSTIEAT
jgi:hypothetical protein